MEKYYINPNNTYWGSVVDSEEPPFPGAVEVSSAPEVSATQVWDAGTETWGEYVPPAPSPLEQLEALITQGQEAMAEAPLPDDIQKDIFDLEVFVQNYYRRNAFHLIRAAIESFTIAPERQDVTQGQRAQVEGLKTLMLAVFNG